MAIEKLYTESKTTGSRLTAEEFNKLPEKINELIDAHNKEEERIMLVVVKNRPTLGQLQNVNTEADDLTSEPCVLVWRRAADDSVLSESDQSVTIDNAIGFQVCRRMQY